MPTVLSNVTISGNQTSSGLIVPATYSATVLSGGTAVGTTVEGYGALFVSSGGYASGTVVGSGGVEQVSAGGVASGSVVSLGGQEAVGGTALGTVVSGAQAVLAGGTAVGTVVSNGSELVDSGGVTSNAYLGGQVGGSYLAGQEAVSSGGLAVSTTVSADGDLEVGSGGTALGAVVSGSEDVYGYASGSVISGGYEAVYGGGTAYATVIAASGTLDLTEDASAAQDGVTFAGADGELIVGVVGESSPTPRTPVSGFAATDRIDLAGVAYTSSATASFADGVLTISAGGQAYTLDLPDLPNGTAFALEPDALTVGGAASGTMVLLNSGNDATVSSGVISSGVVVSATETLTVLFGGTAIATTVDGYGTLAVSSGGHASSTIVSSAGSEQVSAGGVASGTVVSFGGQESVGGTALGTVVSGGQAVLAGGTAVGAVVDNGGQAVSSGGVTSGSVVESASETVSSGGLAVSTTVSAAGSLTVDSGGTTIAAVIGVAGGEIVFGGVASGTVISGGGESVDEGGTTYATVIASSGTLYLDDGYAQGGLTFSGAAGELIVGPAPGGTSTIPTTPISGFTATDKIDLAGIIYTSAATASFEDGGLTVSAGGTAYTLDLPDLPSGTAFALEPDSGGGTLVLARDIPCFAAGTRIRTEAGHIAVEDLRVGDRVVTQDGRLRPITWIGHRQIRPDRHPRPWQVRPVRIEAHAFGPNQPKAALSLSPDHAILAEGVLIPIKHLINGMTVRQVETDSVTYFHVELPEHDVILAEGLPAESYLDTGDRLSFANGAVTELHPAFGSERQDVALVMDALGCTPLRIVGPEVERVRALLAARTWDVEPLRQDVIITVDRPSGGSGEAPGGLRPRPKRRAAR